jgi:DNA mismatch repair protein PMS2
MYDMCVSFGIDSIVVSDNGAGIEKGNYADIAMKHHTSKLSTFADLTSVSSYGFRGEALNALCELSGKFSISTKTKHDAVGSLLGFNRQGR